jgi:FkbM family methyltransferase
MKYTLLLQSRTRAVDDKNESSIQRFDVNRVYILPLNLYDCYAMSGLFESNLIEWSKQFCNRSKVFLDIGAHTGTYTVSLATHSMKTYAFEPQRTTYYALCGSVALSGLSDRVECMMVGLGSQEQIGRQTLNIVSEDGGGSSLHQSESLVINQEDIEIKTLDSFDISDIGFIKMDVEDNELQVLEGAQSTLKRSGFPTILFESNQNSYREPLFKYVSSIGYKITAINGYGNMFLATL